MCLSAIFQSLYNLIYGSQPPETSQKEWDDLEYPLQLAPDGQPYVLPIDRIVMGRSAPLGSFDNSVLRSRANAERARMIESLKRGRQAQSRADKAAARSSVKEHQQKMQSLNKEASKEIFGENNKRNRPGIIDLHGLYITEAIKFTDRAIQEVTERKDAELRLIVGQGLHSEGGMPKLKPAIEKHLQRRQLIPQVDPKNPGLLIVRIDSEQKEESPLLGHKR